MSNQVRGSLHTVLGAVFMVGVLFFAGNSSLVSAQGLPVGGDTSSLQQLQELITKLRAQLSLLNAGAPSSSVSLKIGAEVTVTDSLRVRKSPSTSGVYIGVQPAGAKGVVVEGPIRADGHNWLKVDYETGPDGWNSAGWLKQQTAYEGEQVTPDKCSYNERTYETGDKIVRNLTAATTSLQSGTRERQNSAEFECISGKWRLSESGNSTTYTFSETKLITKEVIDPNKRAIDDEYSLYRITLLNGKIHEVKVFGRMQTSARDSEFRKTGYVGSVTYLMDRAQVVVAETEGGPGLPVATSTPSKPVVKACLSSNKEYKEGDTLKSIVVDGKTRTISDGKFVCRSKVWEVDGSTNPKPVPVPVVVKKPTCTVIASDSAITEGGTTRLTWTASNAVSGFLNNGIGEIDPNNKEGFRNVKPLKDTTYVITVKNSKDEQVTCSKKIVVTSKPIPPVTQVPTPTPKPVPAPDTLADAMCINSGVGYKLGEKAISLNIGGEKTTMSGQWFVCNKFKGWTTVRDSQYDSIRYFVYDVKTITKQSTANNETIFKIVLENGKTHTVKVAGTCEDQKCYREFAKTGYAGYMSWILEKAKVIKATPVVKGASTDILSEIETTLATIALLLKESK